MSTGRLHILFILFVVSAVALVGRLFSLQVYDYGTFAAFARGQQQVFQDLLPERGKILAGGALGEPIVFAANRDLPTVYAVPRDVEDVEEVLTLLQEVLALDDETVAVLAARLTREDDPYEPIAEKITEEQAERISEANLAGINVVDERHRVYPQGSRLAHVLGFVGFDAFSNLRGVYGIETAFEKELVGVPGKLRGERDGEGRLLETFTDETQAAQPGADIVLTIDPNIQYQTEKFLDEAREKYQASGGTVIVMDVKTGAIRAMANVPVFNPNTYSDVPDIGIYINAAISAPYEPGSIFKAITMAAALDTGAVYPEMTFENTGIVEISGYRIGNVLTQYDGKTISMIDVLRHSLNTGAIFVERQTGHEKFTEYVKAFGFGTPTGLMLPGEAQGSIGNLETGREINYATASFGQGISVTPLQMVNAISTIANGGTMMRPYIISEVRWPDGTVEARSPEKVSDVVSPRTATRIAAMLTRVVDDGSGYMSQIPGYSVAGKTGTAQIANIGTPGYTGEHIHSFVGFFPAFDPVYAMLIKLDRPQGVRYASVSVAPVFRRIAEYLITYAAIPPDRPIAD